MLTLVKETGAGLPNANSYASAADGDSYHDGHLYASTWTGASTANKEKALVMASRLIDASYQFHGFQASLSQALQWPRVLAYNPDARSVPAAAWGSPAAAYFAADAIPPDLVKATCEMARELIAQDRTAAPEGEGVSQFTLVGALSLTFDKSDRMPVIAHLAQSFLSKLGCLISERRGVARLVRT